MGQSVSRLRTTDPRSARQGQRLPSFVWPPLDATSPKMA